MQTSCTGRQVLYGVKFTAHVAEFDRFIRPLVLRYVRARVCNALMFLMICYYFCHADFFDKQKRTASAVRFHKQIVDPRKAFAFRRIPSSVTFGDTFPTKGEGFLAASTVCRG